MKIAIMQPTYIPWIGYFALMDQVDKFVFLDFVQFSYQSWQHHNQIKTGSGIQKLTIPVLAKSQGRRDQLIRDVKIDTSNRKIYPGKHIRAIEMSYQKAPYFDQFAPELFEILQSGEVYLSSLTETLILWLRDKLEISTPIEKLAENPYKSIKAELVAEMCYDFGATEYLSPMGAKNYIEESDSFKKRGVEVSYQRFEHPVYPQLYGKFSSHMSVIDLLFNCGDNSLEVIRQGAKALSSNI